MSWFDITVIFIILLITYILAHGIKYFDDYPFVFGIIASFSASLLVNKILLLEMEPCRKV